jgi:hypothetical protein
VTAVQDFGDALRTTMNLTAAEALFQCDFYEYFHKNYRMLPDVFLSSSHSQRQSLLFGAT